jgi:hypothetical protein
MDADWYSFLNEVVHYSDAFFSPIVIPTKSPPLLGNFHLRSKNSDVLYLGIPQVYIGTDNSPTRSTIV